MKISSITSYKNYNPSFSSTTRTTYISDSEGIFVLPKFDKALQKTVSFSPKSDVRMVSSNSTSFFRKDFPWDRIGAILEKQFPKGKVNIYDFACSDGSEAFSLVISLIEQLGERKAQRFFPIKASDVDPEIIRMASSGRICANTEDMYQLRKRIKNGNVKKYFDVTELSEQQILLAPKEILRKYIIFEEKNITSGLDEIKKDENNVVLARNFWKYLTSENLASASWKLNEKLDEKTLVAIGNFDLQGGEHIPFFLKNLGLTFFGDEKSYINILHCKRDFANFLLLKSEKIWDEFVRANQPRYVPKYIG